MSELQKIREILQIISICSSDTLKIVGRPSLAGIEFELILEKSRQALRELEKYIENEERMKAMTSCKFKGSINIEDLH